MSKKHPGRTFALGAMIGSTIGALSAMLFTTRKGHSLQKNMMKKYQEFEKTVRTYANGKAKKVWKSMPRKWKGKKK